MKKVENILKELTSDMNYRDVLRRINGTNVYTVLFLDGALTADNVAVFLKNFREVPDEILCVVLNRDRKDLLAYILKLMHLPDLADRIVSLDELDSGSYKDVSALVIDAESFDALDLPRQTSMLETEFSLPENLVLLKEKTGMFEKQPNIDTRRFITEGMLREADQALALEPFGNPLEVNQLLLKLEKGPFPEKEILEYKSALDGEALEKALGELDLFISSYEELFGYEKKRNETRAARYKVFSILRQAFVSELTETNIKRWMDNFDDYQVNRKKKQDDRDREGRFILLALTLLERPVSFSGNYEGYENEINFMIRQLKKSSELDKLLYDYPLRKDFLKAAEKPVSRIIRENIGYFEHLQDPENARKFIEDLELARSVLKEE